jgi:hypothetical protein
MSEPSETFECEECNGDTFPTSEARTTADGVKLCPSCYQWLSEQPEAYE